MRYFNVFYLETPVSGQFFVFTTAVAHSYGFLVRKQAFQTFNDQRKKLFGVWEKILGKKSNSDVEASVSVSSASMKSR